MEFKEKMQNELPEFNKDAFYCPNCNAYAKQRWIFGTNNYDGVDIAICEHCYKKSIWFKEKMIYPKNIDIEKPLEVLNKRVKSNYMEAREIFNDSPKGACALLRLALQELCIQLGKDGKDINNNIKELVNDGLPNGVQKALDIVRVIGNEAVHPGTIDVNDNEEIALKLFKLINFIAEKMIVEPKELEELYEKLPENKRDQIKNRDKASKE